MALSKFAIACVAAVFAGGLCARLSDGGTASASAQVIDENPVTPISDIARPDDAFRGLSVRLVSGHRVGHVVSVATDAKGRATKIRVALDDMPGQTLWLAQTDLVYSRARDAIIAHDIHAPAVTLADAR